MNILVFNCGSSSLKYKIIKLPEEQVLAGGEAQRVGPQTSEPSKIFHRKDNDEIVIEVPMRNHDEAFDEVMKVITADESLIPDAVGHRIVHGSEIFVESTLLNAELLKKLEGISGMAPLHNPPAVNLIKACFNKYPHLPQIGVFDTAFHSTIPEYAKVYPIQESIAEKLSIKKYGFHGTSHRFVIEEAAAFLNINLDEFNAVSCHLGSGGASLCAVKNGKSVDNTMGFSPLQGLVMSTRSGDFDPGSTMKLLFNSLGDFKEVEKILNRQSGVLGLSGTSADIRDILNIDPGVKNQTSEITRKVYIQRIKKYLGSYLTVVGKADAVIFTDTIGETIPYVREAVCSGLEVFGVKIDRERNNHVSGMPVDIADDESKTRILVILTNEELAIARESYQAINSLNKLNQSRNGGK